jgi:hypothetical protein
VELVQEGSSSFIFDIIASFYNVGSQIDRLNAWASPNVRRRSYQALQYTFPASFLKGEDAWRWEIQDVQVGAGRQENCPGRDSRQRGTHDGSSTRLSSVQNVCLVPFISF